MIQISNKPKSVFRRFLDWVERVGNKLPHPFTMFIILAVLTMVLSAIFSFLNIKVIHPGTQEEVVIRSLFAKEGILWIIESFLKNFIGFTPLGLVLVMT
ncbi:MAG TPA: AbgT family transporter, partial [Patescibacteria group bacterium]|nr:AbgT family transporter [Patescibacteria group bacterium]